MLAIKLWEDRIIELNKSSITIGDLKAVFKKIKQMEGTSDGIIVFQDAIDVIADRFLDLINTSLSRVNFLTHGKRK